MLKCWRPLVIAAALNVTVGAAMSAAQTVMLRNAPAGAKVEVLLNGAPVGSGQAGPDGEATIALNTGDTIGPGGLDTNIALDACEAVRRVVLTDHAKAAVPPAAGCDRHEISGIFWVRQINTLVFDLSGNAPSLLLIKGKYVYHAPVPEDQPHVWRPLPTGLALFGGAGTAKFSNAFGLACGNVSPCTGQDSGLGAYSFGATYWFTRFLAAEGGYIKPRDVIARGGDTFTFNSTQNTELFTVVGKIGIPAGPVRLYGLAGGNYHQASTNSSETIDLTTQSFALKTRGWGWMFGGGGEVWIWKKVALYSEFDIARLKGSAEGGGEAIMDDHLAVIVGGIKVRLSPK
jgi:hypothetical protein